MSLQPCSINPGWYFKAVLWRWSTMFWQTAENYFYVPDLGQVPEIDVPSYLPDLPGIADDLSYSADLGPGFAPSGPTHIIPELPAFSEDSASNEIVGESVKPAKVSLDWPHPVLGERHPSVLPPPAPPPPPPPPPAPATAAGPPPPPPPPPLPAETTSDGVDVPSSGLPIIKEKKLYIKRRAGWQSIAFCFF